MLSEKLFRDLLVLVATIDPVGTLVLFAGLTAHLTGAQRRTTALKATLYATGVLVGAIVVGQIILTGMGVGLLSLQIAGGLILFVFGMQMVFGNEAGSGAGPEQGHDLAVYPLAVPSIASPGSIMAAIVLTDNDRYPIPTQIATGGAMLGVLLATFLLMLAADPILRVIGRNGALILVRVSGMLLASLAVQLTLEGLLAFLASQ
jgi:multiple antibiotic resistance protein